MSKVIAKAFLLCQLLLMASMSVKAAAAENGVIEMASRNIFLNEPDATLFTNLVIFTPGSANKVNGKTIFEYVVAADYADTLIAMKAINSDTKEKLTVTKMQGPLSPMNHPKYNETDFLWYQIDVSSSYMNGEKTIKLDIDEMHKRRLSASPARVSLVND